MEKPQEQEIASPLDPPADTQKLEKSKSLHGIDHGKNISDYNITAYLGKGAHSQVYEVQCKICEKSFALKKVAKKQVASENLTQKLLNEIEIHQKLKHIRILQLLCYFEDRETVYLLLELCKNGQLAILQKSKGVMSEQYVSKVFKQITEGVKYLHENNILHRDLKLANIMLTDQGDIKIGDFGLAVQLKSAFEERDTMCGTPNYIAPEILMQIPYSFETDMWSLGCILYTLLVGVPPFERTNVQDTLEQVKNGVYDVPEKLSLEAKDLIRRLICRKIKERSTVEQILEHPFLANAVDAQVNLSHILIKMKEDKSPLGNSESSTPSPVPMPIPESKLPKKAPQPSPPARINTTKEPEIIKEREIADKKEIKTAPLEKKKMRMTVVQTDQKQIKKNSLAENPKYAKSVMYTSSSDFDKENQENNIKGSIQKIVQPLTETKKTKSELKPFSTARLKTFIHDTPRGRIKIDATDGSVELEISNKAKIMKISSNGQKIIISSKIIENCALEYTLKTLPKKFHAIYKYASDFVNIVRSKTPKIIFKCEEYKCFLMEDEPFHTCELRKEDGTKAVYQLSGDTIDIYMVDGNHVQLRPKEDYDYLSCEMKLLIDTFFFCIRKCLEIQKNSLNN